jgi:hypothetical protein
MQDALTTVGGAINDAARAVTRLAHEARSRAPLIVRRSRPVTSAI